MFKKDNIINFLYPKDSKKLFEDVFPIPTKLNIPEWFKNLKTQKEYVTIKSCIPFLDAITAGYILKMPQDFYVKHNFMNKELKKRDSAFRSGFHEADLGALIAQGINMNTSKTEMHRQEQLGKECPFNKKNKDLSYYKILNPFKIKTPPGYSCLFVSPLNNADDRFNIISGIVDTDTFSNNINFPIIINGDKYPHLETTIKKGTPYVQVIPFKREDWKMKIEEYKESPLIAHLTIMKELWNNYKNNFWSKKKWN
tara:strand:- start:74 stop:835 length:762 start_codon:yes stop_codon:yes gene_type:complete